MVHQLRQSALVMCGCVALITLVVVPATGETVDRLLVESSGLTRESAIGYTEETAVTMAIERYVRPAALESHRQEIRYRILDQSPGYINSLKIIGSSIDDDGIYHIRAEAEVSVDRLLTSLRNLNVEVKMWAPGPNQAIEGRRGTGRRTGRDRFKEPIPD